MTQRRRPQRGRQAPAVSQELPPAANPQLRAAILEVVDTQLATGDPPDTQQTLDRLVAQGYSREGARELIAHIVVYEIFNVMARGEVYNAVRYKAALARLPALPTEY